MSAEENSLLAIFCVLYDIPATNYLSADFHLLGFADL